MARLCACGGLAVNPPAAGEPKCWFHMALGSAADQAAQPLPVVLPGAQSTSFAVEGE